jgi:hypothetical protein
MVMIGIKYGRVARWTLGNYSIFPKFLMKQIDNISKNFFTYFSIDRSADFVCFSCQYPACQKMILRYIFLEVPGEVKLWNK